MTEPNDSVAVPETREAGSIIVRSQRSDDFLDALGDRIANPATPIEQAMWLTRLRQELVRQEEARADRQHVRRMESRQFITKGTFSAAVIALGAGLIYTGFGIEGFVVIGAGLYWLAPNFVTDVYRRVLGDGQDRDE